MKLNVSLNLVVKELTKNCANNLAAITCQISETSTDVLDLRDLNRGRKYLMIFNDLQLEKQNKCKTYYVR